MSSRNSKIANRLLWTAQILAALLFLFAGASKFLMSADQLQQGPVALPVPFIHFIGICECLGALGLVLPGLLRIRTDLTPLAAAGLTVIMAGATTLSVIGFGVAAAIFPAIVGVVTASIVHGRTNIAPIATAPRRTLRLA